MGVIGAAADEAALGLEFRNARGVEPRDDVLDFFHHLRADAVARKQEQVIGGHVSFHA
jgi:hypothetical protein